MVRNLEKVITSKEIIRLSEIWIPSKGIKTDVFENPDSSDIKELYKNIKDDDKFIRFYADAKTQKVYAWSGHDAIHVDILKLNGFYGSYQVALDNPSLLIGYGKIRGGRIVLYDQESSIRKISGSIDILNSYFQWNLSPKAVKSRFGPHIAEEKTWLTQFFNYNWTFVDRYISGVLPFIINEKKRFKEWVENHNF